MSFCVCYMYADAVYWCMGRTQGSTTFTFASSIYILTVFISGSPREVKKMNADVLIMWLK